MPTPTPGTALSPVPDRFPPRVASGPGFVAPDASCEAEKPASYAVGMNETSLIAPSAETVALHAELVVVSKDYHQAEHRLAVLLARMQADQRHRELGYVNVIDYAEQELGLGRKTAFALAKLGRELPTAPLVEQALAEGSLGWTKARELLKVVVPETEQQWVDFARTSSSRDLERQVRSAVPGESPHVGTPKLPEIGRMTISGATVDLEVIQDCIRLVRANTGIAKDHLDD